MVSAGARAKPRDVSRRVVRDELVLKRPLEDAAYGLQPVVGRVGVFLFALAEDDDGLAAHAAERAIADQLIGARWCRGLDPGALKDAPAGPLCVLAVKLLELGRLHVSLAEPTPSAGRLACAL
jgi:hypothetical protein